MAERKAATYNEEFADLNTHLHEMAQMVRDLILLSVENLDERSESHAEQVQDKENRIRELDNNTEQLVNAFLMRRTPMGADLRRVTTTIRMTSDLERMGILASHIARRAVNLEGYKAKKSVKRLKNMAEIVSRMLEDAVHILTHYDDTVLHTIFAHDETLDELYQELSIDIQEIMADKPKKIEQCTHLLFIAKHLESLGDRIKELSRSAHFIATGESIGTPARIAPAEPSHPQ